MDPLETIRERLAKLRAIVNCAGAPEGEKAAARAGIARLLERHSLTEESVDSAAIGLFLFEFEKARWGRQLMLQCAGWLLQVQPVPVHGIDRKKMAMKLTALDAADLRACYGYYCTIMRAEMIKLDAQSEAVRKEVRARIAQIKKEEAKALKKIGDDKAAMLDAMVLKFKLSVRRAPEDAPKKETLTDEEFKKWAKRIGLAGNIKGDAWERGAKVGEGEEVFRLEG